MSIQSFAIDVPQATLDDLRDRLARPRWPDEVEGAGWDYGTNLAYLKELVDYWQHTYDWRKQEVKKNGCPRENGRSAVYASSVGRRCHEVGTSQLWKSQNY